MKKIYILLACLILILSISACPSRTGAKIGVSFVGGSQGLTAKFLEDEPPARVLDESSEDFYITVELENKGEDTVEVGEAAILLSGISASEFGLDVFSRSGSGILNYNKEDVLAVRKDRTEIISGGVATVSFGPASYLEDVTADIEFPLQADICYRYDSEALSSLCLKKNTIQRSWEATGEACKIDSIKDVETSGGPIRVENVRERPAGSNQVMVSFDVANIGGGEIWSFDSVNSPISSYAEAVRLFEPYFGESIVDFPCTESVAERRAIGRSYLPEYSRGVGLERDRVFVFVETALGTDLPKCTKFDDLNFGVARLTGIGITDKKGGTVGKRTTITCIIDTYDLQSTAFESPLKIYVLYAYKDVIRSTILVEDTISSEEEIEFR